jgi:glutaconate CoA-transferase subunit B
VITDKAMFGYDESTHRMKLLAVARWSSVEEILANMDFEPMIAERLETIEPPTEDELLVMRTQVDPGGRTVGSGEWITVEVD